MNKVQVEPVFRAVFQIIVDFLWRMQEVEARLHTLEGNCDIEIFKEVSRFSDCSVTVTLVGEKQSEVEAARNGLEMWCKHHHGVRYK